MPNIPDITSKIPFMFRSQIKGRSQLQFIDAEKQKQGQKQDSERWVSEWIERVHPFVVPFGDEVQTRNYQLSWRFVTNGGQDEGIIRPVIGAYGLPFYPGSSMKGAFIQACDSAQKQRYRLTKNGDEPSLLRFHGGYPVNNWTENLLDIVHPQQGWQVKTPNTTEKPGRESGYALISLFEPIFIFGISSLVPDADWDEIWKIWEKALGYGLGCRVSSGYGLGKVCVTQQGEAQHPIKPQGDLLYRCFLKGQGPAPQLLDKTSEFRANIFRAALRGHGLRIFGGLTDEKTAEDLVETLFGGIQGEAKQGLLAIAFQESSLILDTFDEGYGEPTYQVSGKLSWLLTQPLPHDDHKRCLRKLIGFLMRFAMLLGGFGKSWRRADHRLFYKSYYSDHHPLIGCHWQWDNKSLVDDNKVRSLNHVAPFLKELRQTAQAWMNLQGVNSTPNQVASWRESWHPDKVQVWGRIAEDKGDSLAIHWLHQPYQKGDRHLQQPELTIKGTSVTGCINQISRLWHRMYPVVRLVTNDEGQKIPKNTHQYLELLTIFPDSSQQFQDFINFLEIKAQGQHSDTAFKRLWP